jgi:hypothetical protein
VPRLSKWNAASAAAAAASAAAASSRPPPHASSPEVANLAACGSLVAIASRVGATLVDLRSGRECAHVTPPQRPPPSSNAAAPPARAAHDPAWTRSVCLRSRGGGVAGPAELLSVGTADGRLLLYDLRACGGGGGGGGGGGVLGVGGVFGGSSSSKLLAAHALSDGHLDRDDPAYRARFAPLSFPAAAQAHAWERLEPAGGRRFSPAGGGGGGAAAASRVFVAGGPLPSGVRGCYMGVWL